MRAAINAAARIAHGEYLMKLDGHCMVAPGFDVTLAADCDRDWVVIPRRYPLEPEAWTIEERTDRKYPVDYHFLSWPYERPGDPDCGLHGDQWKARRDARQHLLVDEEMSSQGSCWFMHRDQWARMGELDAVSYGPFYQEFQEIGLKTWLGGGQVMVNKQTWYAHLRKGTKYGRGYQMHDFRRDEVTRFTADYWMNDRWPKATRTLRWLIERFSPVPTWPSDLDAAFRAAKPPAGLRSLVILSARYGTAEREADVTERLREVVTAEKPELTVTNEILGIDPHQGKRKRLAVEYEADGRRGSAAVQERGFLRLTLPAQTPITISYCLPCHKRTEDLLAAWPSVVAAANASPPVEIVLVDYANDQPLPDQWSDVCTAENRLRVVVYRGREHYHMAHARNLSIRAATGDYILIASADFLPTPELFTDIRQQIAQSGAVWLEPSSERLVGAICVKRDELIAAGGYDERFEFYGPEDKELNARLRRRGLSRAQYSAAFLSLIPTPDAKRVQNYRLPLGKRSMHEDGMRAYLDNEARGVLVVNEGIDWGSLEPVSELQGV